MKNESTTTRTETINGHTLSMITNVRANGDYVSYSIKHSRDGFVFTAFSRKDAGLEYNERLGWM